MVRCNPIDNFFSILKYTHYRKNSINDCNTHSKQNQNEGRTQNHYDKLYDFLSTECIKMFTKMFS